MVVAGFDIATTTGCAILDGTKVVHAEAYRAVSETETRIRRDAERKREKPNFDRFHEKIDGEIFHAFRSWLRPLLVAHGVQHVAIEQPLVTNIEMPSTRPGAKPGEVSNPVTFRTYLRLYGLRAHAIEICEALNAPVIEVHQATWRKSFTGNGRATKDDTLKLAQRLVPGLKSKDAGEAVGIAWHLNGELTRKPEADLFAGAA